MPLDRSGFPGLSSFYGKVGKRVLDLLLAGLGIAVLVPVYACLAVLVRLRLGSPILFRQERNGLDGKVFQVIKFRTMTQAAGPDGALLPDEERKHPFGDLLRRTSLDELPELFLVLTGKMSLVGPRPLPTMYWERYSERQRLRHLVKPGITGLAQVCGRNTLSWEEKFELDLEYVRRQSALFDALILFKTIGSVLRREGISKESHYTCDVFLGSTHQEAR